MDFIVRQWTFNEQSEFFIPLPKQFVFKKYSVMFSDSFFISELTLKSVLQLWMDGGDQTISQTY